MGHVRGVICAAPGYLAQHGVPQRPADLHDHYIISASPVTPSVEWRLVRDATPHTIRLQPRLTTTTNDSAMARAFLDLAIERLRANPALH